MMTEPTKIGKLDRSDKLGTALHDAARFGQTKNLKKILQKGINVDFPNSSGQSPLFTACYYNQVSSAYSLLKRGANANERSLDGATPVHAACYSCNLKILSKLLGSGGDLRLHDNLARTPRDWIMLQSDPKKKLKMIEFVEKTRYFAMSGNSREWVKGSSSFVDRTSENANSVIRFVRDKIKGDSGMMYAGEVKSVQSMGFGKVYLDNETWHGMISLTPLVAESSLRHDNIGMTYNNGSFMVMESMTWIKTDVTVKRLHRQPQDGGHVDLLINESEFMGKVHHPDVLLFMGLCQTNNLDGLVLLYERIGVGSLFHYLHDRFDEVSYQQIVRVIGQMCNALIFLHQQNLIHSSITSHAINLISPVRAKLGNFEYMVECSSNGVAEKKTLASTNMMPNALYNWLAPELMDDNPPRVASDMYSLCMVIFEIFEDKIPWEDCSAGFIRQKLVVDGYSITCKSPRIPKLFQAILEYGLQFEPADRRLTFEQLRDLLMTQKSRDASAKAQIQDDSGSVVEPSCQETELKKIESSTTNNTTITTGYEPTFDPTKAGKFNVKKIPEVDVFKHHDDKSANKSSSDEVPCSTLSSDSCDSMNPACAHPTVQFKGTPKAGKRRGSLFSEKHCDGHEGPPTVLSENKNSDNVEIYRDTEETLHYSVYIPSKPTPEPSTWRSTVRPATTLPRSSAEKKANTTLYNPKHTEQDSTVYSTLSRNLRSGSLDGSSSKLRGDVPAAQPHISVPSVSIPQPYKLKQEQKFRPVTPSMIHSSLPSVNIIKHSCNLQTGVQNGVSRLQNIETEGCSTHGSWSATVDKSSANNAADSSPSGFSYLSLERKDGPSIKPASHITGREGDSLGMSSNSGSIFALYNSFRRTQRPPGMVKDNIHNSPNGKSGKPSDDKWYGGSGSVRNLVKKYQNHSEVHEAKQAVLEGKSTEKLSNQDIRRRWFEVDQSSNQKKKPEKMQQDTVDHPLHRAAPMFPVPSSSNAPVGKHRSPCQMKKTEKVQDSLHHQHPIPCSSTAPVVKNSPITFSACDSDDDDRISNWVSFHLNRINKELTSEESQTDSTESQDRPPTEQIAEQESSPLDECKAKNERNDGDSSSVGKESSENDSTRKENELVDEEQLSTTETWSSTVEDSERGSSMDKESNSGMKSVEGEIHLKKEGGIELEEFYFDDVIHPDLTHAKHLHLQGTSSLQDHRTMMKKVMQKGRSISDANHDGKKRARNPRRTSPEGQHGPEEDPVGESNPFRDPQISDAEIVSQPSKKIASKISTEGSTTVVSVRTSGRKPWKHTITHTETDLSTGLTETVNAGTVQAPKVVSQICAGNGKS